MRVPRKAAYLEFDDDLDAEYEFFLAGKLGMTVAQLGEMDNAEYVRWVVYHGREMQRRELAAKGG